MKTAIICFSQTGNTRKLAEKIRDGIIESAAECDLIPLKDVKVDTLQNYDLLGLGCPVYYYKEPFNVREFMESLPPQTGKHWFVFCSHGAVMGQTLFSMTECLTQKGAVVIGSHHCYADATVPFYPKHTLTSGHPDVTDFEEAFDFGNTIISRGQAVSKGDTSCISKPDQAPEEWARKDATALSRDVLSQIMPPFSINTETCVQCGECQDCCPVDGIDIQSDPIRLQAPCIYCLQCAAICPTCSIQADWRSLVEMAPANYTRYREALNAAEKRGEFRWLVNPETVDCSYPLHKQKEDELNEKSKLGKK